MEALSPEQQQAVLFAYSNDLVCSTPVAKPSDCELTYNRRLTPPKNSKGKYSPDLSYYLANLTANLEISSYEDLELQKTPGIELLATFDIPDDPTKSFGALFQNRQRPDIAYLIFRGTIGDLEWSFDLMYDQTPLDNRRFPFMQENSMKWLSNNEQIPYDNMDREIPSCHGGSQILVHSGFAFAYREIQEALLEVLKEHAEISFLNIAGHSLGAAVATLAAYDLCSSSSFFQRRYRNRDLSCQVYLYGSPRVGNIAFSQQISRERKIRGIFSIQNENDIVCSVPPAVTPNFLVPGAPLFYQHVGKVFYFRDNFLSWLGNHELPIYIQNITGKSLCGQQISICDDEQKKSRKK